jgi:hypothetical protein
LSQALSPLIPEAGLQNISEDQEETEDDLSTARSVSPEKPTAATQGDHTAAKPPDEPQLLQDTIQGLKISTSPLQYSFVPSPNVHRRAYSVTSSPSRNPTSLPHDSQSRPFSSSPHPRSSSLGSLHSRTSVSYDPVGDRVPGNPLFPSNFARLAVGPTLKAKCVPFLFLKLSCELT